MEVGSVQNTVIGMLDKQKELDTKVKAIKNSVIVSIVRLQLYLKQFLIDSRTLESFQCIKDFLKWQVKIRWLALNSVMGKYWVIVATFIYTS